MLDTTKIAGIPTEQDPRWQAVITRDSTFDDQFFYSVKTTGVYCRPSCAAREAKPQNVRFHLTCEDAEQAGFRPCKRCKPNQPALHQQHAAKIAEICRMIESAEEIPSLDELARKAQLECLPFSSSVQGHYRHHAEGLCHRQPCQADTRRTRPQRHDGDGSDLRIWIQFQRQVLRKFKRGIRHDSY